VEPEFSQDGRTPVQFTTSAMNMVAALSRGLPRLVNTICDRALEASFERRERTVNRKAVQLAAKRLRLPIPTSQTLSPLRLAGVAAVVLAAAIGGWWWAHRTPEPASAGSPVSGPAAAPVAAPLAPPAPSGPPDAAPPAASSPAAASSQIAADAPGAKASAPTGYEITAASFKTEERATSVAESLTRSGLPVAARIDATGQWYRVVVGPFATSDEAKAAQETLERQGFSGTHISGR
jgi:cell division septation protein DedD